MLSSVIAGLNLLTISAKLLSFPLIWEMATYKPRCFCPIASSFVNFLENLFKLVNCWCQLLANLFLLPQCSIGCHLNTVFPVFMAAANAKKFTMIAASSNLLTNNLSIWPFRRLMQRSIVGSKSSQLSYHQNLSSTEPPPISQLVQMSYCILPSVIWMMNWLIGRIHQCVCWMCWTHYILIHARSSAMLVLIQFVCW